jgi:hypothetical protein
MEKDNQLVAITYSSLLGHEPGREIGKEERDDETTEDERQRTTDDRLEVGGGAGGERVAWQF